MKFANTAGKTAGKPAGKTASRTAAALAAVCFLLACAPGVAAAEPGPTAKQQAAASPAMCAKYPDHAAYLAKAWGEHPVFTGTMNGQFVMRVFANRATGTWTLVMVHASGLSCVRATGSGGQPNMGL